MDSYQRRVADWPLAQATVGSSVRHVTDRSYNPFGLAFPCEEFVPGAGDVNADFHVIGDHPGVHGGVEAGIAFTGRPWSLDFFAALSEGGLVEWYDTETPTFDAGRTFLGFV